MPICNEVTVSSLSPNFTAGQGVYRSTYLDRFGGPVYESVVGSFFLYRTYTIDMDGKDAELGLPNSWIISPVLNTLNKEDLIAYSYLKPEHNPSTVLGPYDVENGEWFLVSIANVDATMQVICFDECSGTVELGASGSISTGTGVYSNNHICQFKFTSIPGHYLNLTFTAFNLELGSDYLRIYDVSDGVSQRHISTLSGNFIPENIFVYGSGSVNVCSFSPFYALSLVPL
jgi:hypothetical protein